MTTFVSILSQSTFTFGQTLLLTPIESLSTVLRLHFLLSSFLQKPSIEIGK